MVDSPRCLCRAKMVPVFYAQQAMRCNAWYCERCGQWGPAVGREKKITQDFWEDRVVAITGEHITDADYRPLPADLDVCG